MYTTEYKVRIDLDKATAWEKLRDFSKADFYVQGLTRVEITTAATEGVGASRKVHQGERIVLDETITDWHPGEGFTIRLHRGTKGPVPPMKEAYFDYGLVEEDGQVYLHNRMRYRLGLGPIGTLLNKLVVGKMIYSALRDTTVGQKIYYETGAKVSPELLQEGLSALRSAG